MSGVMMDDSLVETFSMHHQDSNRSDSKLSSLHYRQPTTRLTLEIGLVRCGVGLKDRTRGYVLMR